mmetsp:Transcript_26469/g.88694  ORF Transcript_26469/g.88694 Transcript_26469/m.88694 type:complete len:259 (+) Transcript_26469:245-1021(+)
MSNFFCSSFEGRPICFRLWSSIIFSTTWRVSPSRSERLEFSGSTFCVLISGSPTITRFHHSMSLTFCSVMFTTRLSSTSHMESSAFTLACSSPSMMGGWPLIPTRILRWVICTSSCLLLVPGGTSTKTLRSWRVCVHRYLSVMPPLLIGVAPLSSSSDAGAAAGALVSGFTSSLCAAAVLGPAASSRTSSKRLEGFCSSSSFFARSASSRLRLASSSALRFSVSASFAFWSASQSFFCRSKAVVIVSWALPRSPAPLK